MTLPHGLATFSATKAKQWGYIRAGSWKHLDPNPEMAGGEAYGWVSMEEGYKTQATASSVSNRHLTISFVKTT